ncbi:MAG TPA: DCC1-like thiol-disulfide oxidoreductase family protein [Bradyrhizobium sp.]|nr:DCC1-like thiol-disulfide oxidoreductase family protein [Bradyrhizobium sp.]
MDANAHPVLIYDGECPFCANYVRLLRLRESFPQLELIDARGHPDHPAVQRLRDRNLQIDEGMALVDGDTIYHGSEAVHALADRGTGSTYFGRLNRAIFRSARASNVLYPILRAGRNLTLRLLGRRKLGY